MLNALAYLGALCVVKAVERPNEISRNAADALKADALSNHLFIVDINLYHPVSLPKNFIVMKDSVCFRLLPPKTQRLPHCSRHSLYKRSTKPTVRGAAD